MEVVVIILLILFNGLLSLLEIALISSRQIRMNAMEKDNKMGVKRALQLMDNPDKYLSTIQVGITLIGILTGLYSGDTFAVYLKDYLEQFVPISAYAGFIAKTIIVLIITYFRWFFAVLFYSFCTPCLDIDKKYQFVYQNIAYKTHSRK